MLNLVPVGLPSAYPARLVANLIVLASLPTEQSAHRVQSDNQNIDLTVLAWSGDHSSTGGVNSNEDIFILPLYEIITLQLNIFSYTFALIETVDTHEWYTFW